MAPPKVQSPVSANLRLSKESVVRGCPGVPRSIPRIETTLELRPAQCQPFKIRSVGIELRTIQRIVVPTTLGSNDIAREYKVYEDPMIFRPPIGQFSQEIIGLDIPVLIPLPRDIIASGVFSNWNASTRHVLYVKVSCGDGFENETTFVEGFPITIKTYDTLPLYRQFNEPMFETSTSKDKQVAVELSLPVSCLGPEDDFILFTKVKNNPAVKSKKQMKVNRLSVKVLEILESHEAGLPPKKEQKIYSLAVEFDNSEGMLTGEGVSNQFQFQFPYSNDFLGMYTSKDWTFNTDIYPHSDIASISAANYSRNRYLEKVDEGIPLTHLQSYTSPGMLFSVRFEAAFKIKLTRGKDMDIRIPITVSPYNRISSEYILQWIMKECEYSRQKYGRDFVNRAAETMSYENFLSLMRSFLPPPIVYNNTRQAWLKLGYSGSTYKGSDPYKGMVHYID